jgi:plastocyanin
MAIQKQKADSAAMRWIVIAAIAGIAFLASYRYAVAANSSAQSTSSTGGAPVATAAGGGCGMSGGSGGGGCCGGGAAGPKTTKQADVAGDVQKITVDLSKGYYDPSTVELKAGVPAEITFTQGSGCLAQVQSQDFGFYEDLTAGSKTVKIDNPQAGTYSFSCGMGMVYGSIVVK